MVSCTAIMAANRGAMRTAQVSFIKGDGLKKTVALSRFPSVF
jgi:hypothetical protein